MMNNYKKYIKVIPACVALMSLLSACDDDVRPGAEIQPEGENTVISLTLTAPDFTKRVSRADMSEEDAFTVNTLWVGIYNANDRKSTIIGENNENGLFLTSADELEHGFTAGQKSHDRYTIKNITTKSGPSYIVAVANPDVNYGYKAGESAGSETLLLDLLQNASTWDDFLAIAIKRDLFQGAADVQMPNATQNPLPMSGIYLDDASHADDYDWGNASSYYIPLPKKGETSVSLDGSIHLRRPFTQIKFNIEAAGREDDGVKIIKIEPESFTVHNVPLYGWLYERPQDNPSATNLTDVPTPAMPYSPMWRKMTITGRR